MKTQARFLVLCTALFFVAGAAAATSPAAIPSLAPMLKKASPAVVNIATHGVQRSQQSPMFADPFFRRFFNLPNQPREREFQSAGSGVIIDAKKGYVLTNHHVINDADEITVTLSDRRQVDAKVIGSDTQSDIAVLQIDAKDLHALPIGDSDALQVGDFVVAMGNPFAIGQTATLGIVSALERSGLGIEGYESFIQTDASINPGNSGGALIDSTGHLVGINTAILSRSGGNNGIGFAIPSNMAMSMARQIIDHGEVRRGQIGVTIQDLTHRLADAMGIKNRSGGAVVTGVQPDSAAESAGIKVGDVVVKLNDSVVKSGVDLRNRVGLMAPGSKIRLTIVRDGKEKIFKVTLKEAEQAQFSQGAVEEKLRGVVVTEVPQQDPRSGRVEGVYVLRLDRDSDFARAGVRPGDIIVSVNRRLISSVQDLRSVVHEAGDGNLLLRISRGNGSLFLVVR